MSIFNNTGFRLLEQGLDGVWLKQQVIRQNIANSDTPNYKAKTVEFSAVLEDKQDEYEKVGSRRKKELNLETCIKTERGTSQRMDENNVDAEKEAVALVDAQYQYEVLINKVNTEFSMIKTAISK